MTGNSWMEAQYSLGSLLGTVDMGQDYGKMFFLYTSLPQLSLNFAPSPGKRLLLQMDFSQLVFGLADGECINRFNNEADFSTRLRWDFLSRRGTVKVMPKQYETAFYLGPQLNAGQVKFTLDCAPVRTFDVLDDENNFDDIIQSDEITDKNEINFQLNELGLSIGLADFLTIKGDLHYFDSTGRRESYLPDRRFTSSAALEFRAGPLVLNGGIKYADRPEEYEWWGARPGPDSKHLFVDATFIPGSRITSLCQINGNFDNSFTPTMGPGQLLLHIVSDFITSKDYYKGAPLVHSTTLEHEIRYGVTPIFTVGQQGKFEFGEGNENAVRDLGVDFTMSNIALRTSGPETVSGFEYRYGYWPRAGEFRVDGYLQLPLFDLWGSRWTIDTIQTDAYLGGVFYKMDAPFESSVSNKRFLLRDPVVRCALTYGINPTSIVSNEFCFAAIRRYPPLLTWLMLTGPMVEDKPYTYDNRIWANQFRFHFGDPATHLHAVGLTVAGQTDRAIKKDYRTEFIFSYQFTYGI